MTDEVTKEVRTDEELTVPYFDNLVIISGILENELYFSYPIEDKRYYETKIRVYRKDREYDSIPIVVPRRLVNENEKNGNYAEIRGHFSSYARVDESGRHIEIYVYVTNMRICEKAEELKEPLNTNKVLISGYVFRKFPNYIQLKVPRRDYPGRNYYIPCIPSERIVEKANNIKKKSIVKIQGRAMSKGYIKKTGLDSEIGEYREICQVMILNFL